LVPEFLSLAIARALSKEPGQRFGTMEEFCDGGLAGARPVATPKSGERAKAQRRPPPPSAARTATADAPTEVTNAPTTPISARRVKLGTEKKKRSSVGMVVGALVVVAVASAVSRTGRKS